MTSTTPARLLTAFALLATSSVLALAQPVPTSRLRGTVESVDGDTVHIKTRAGADVSAHLAQDLSVSGVVKITLADIKVGDYVGATTTPGPNDTNVAVEVHTIAQRGAGEGSRPWDLKPNSSMTNGAVDQTLASSDGNTLILKYKTGEKKVTVTPDTVVVTSVSAQRSELKPGAQIFAVANKNPDGSLDITRISIGRDGVAPPM